MYRHTFLLTDTVNLKERSVFPLVALGTLESQDASLGVETGGGGWWVGGGSVIDGWLMADGSYTRVQGTKDKTEVERSHEWNRGKQSPCMVGGHREQVRGVGRH